jgi:hypothetical protein
MPVLVELLGLDAAEAAATRTRWRWPQTFAWLGDRDRAWLAITNSKSSDHLSLM